MYTEAHFHTINHTHSERTANAAQNERTQPQTERMMAERKRPAACYPMQETLTHTHSHRIPNASRHNAWRIQVRVVFLCVREISLAIASLSGRFFWGWRRRYANATTISAHTEFHATFYFDDVKLGESYRRSACVRACVWVCVRAIFEIAVRRWRSHSVTSGKTYVCFPSIQSMRTHRWRWITTESRARFGGSIASTHCVVIWSWLNGRSNVRARIQYVCAVMSVRSIARLMRIYSLAKTAHQPTTSGCKCSTVGSETEKHRSAHSFMVNN